MSELTQMTATRLAALIRAREVSPVEVVEAHLRRVEELNPRLNAVVTLAPDALDEARRAEAALMRGEAVGVLCGVPVTVKDTIETGGLRTTSGTRLRAGYVPDRDAPAVGRLRTAGAIVLGKTNTSELALDYTADNPVFGRTNNPHALSHTAGGSSGGCAAAVAACLTPSGLGSDLVGSIRIPAHFCGVCGFKPTAGRIPGAGHLPPTGGVFSLAASLGTLARSVDDLALFYGALSGDEASPVHEENADRTKRRAAATLRRGSRVAWYADDGVVPVTVETRAAVEAAAGALAAAGMIVVEERPPEVEHGARLWLELFSTAVQDFLRGLFAGREDEGGEPVRALLERAKSAPVFAAGDFFRAWAERDERRARLSEWMEATPILVAPVGAVAAFEHGARKVETGGGAVSVFRAFSYAQTFNAFDLPAAVVPAGRTREGLPVGVQIVGRRGAEWEVLAAARIVEESLGGWQKPAGL